MSRKFNPREDSVVYIVDIKDGNSNVEFVRSDSPEMAIETALNRFKSSFKGRSLTCTVAGIDHISWARKFGIKVTTDRRLL